MLNPYPPVRLLVGRTAILPRFAALLAMLIAVHPALIVVQPACAQDAVSTAQATSTAVDSKAVDSTAAPAQQTAENGKPPAPTDIDQSIARLGSADYRTREEALRQLIALGPSAIGPLSKAARAQDLEVSYRAVRVLQSLLEQEDLTTQQRAAGALQSLATDEDYAVADLAADALALYRLTQQDRALASLRRLGASVSETGFGEDLQIVLDSQWHGKTADLTLLKQMSHLNRLQILYVKLDDEALKILAELTQIDFLDLFGTGVSPESATVLAQALPGVKIDRRNGAMLGIRSLSGSFGCNVDGVEEDSAAKAADFHAGDEIVSIDGHPVQRFEELTALIGAKNIGDSVSVELRRDGQILTKQVTLGRWHRAD